MNLRIERVTKVAAPAPRKRCLWGGVADNVVAMDRLTWTSPPPLIQLLAGSSSGELELHDRPSSTCTLWHPDRRPVTWEAHVEVVSCPSVIVALDEEPFLALPFTSVDYGRFALFPPLHHCSVLHTTQGATVNDFSMSRIVGIGVDVLHLPRLVSLTSRQKAGSARLAARILSAQELAHWNEIRTSDELGAASLRFLGVRSMLQFLALNCLGSECHVLLRFKQVGDQGSSVQSRLPYSKADLEGLYIFEGNG